MHVPHRQANPQGKQQWEKFSAALTATVGRKVTDSLRGMQVHIETRHARVALAPGARAATAKEAAAAAAATPPTTKACEAAAATDTVVTSAESSAASSQSPAPRYETPSHPPSSTPPTCPACGIVRQLADNFCQHCGQQFSTPMTKSR